MHIWKSVRAFYRYWLDTLRDDEHSVMIVDSKPVAALMLTYQRRNVTVAHMVHGSHLQDAPTTPGSSTVALRESRREVFEKLDSFDLIVVLTERQRQDITKQIETSAPIVAIPNSVDLSITVPKGRRAAGRGIMLTSLTARKRVDHALTATIAARASVTVTLDVFGGGGKRAALQRQIDRADAEAFIHLHGFNSLARLHLYRASFLLLTSASEGISLALMESMAAGCIPISYDVPYGPADLIRHGHNGFLVAAGDIEGLRRQIVELVEADPTRIAEIRANAIRTAADFSDEAITRQWAKALRASRPRRPRLLSALTGKARTAASRLHA
ncbi:hypothetical protein BH11ACT2_BH11ACT2_03270 [soil metagenome]